MGWLSKWVGWGRRDAGDHARSTFVPLEWARHLERLTDEERRAFALNVCRRVLERTRLHGEDVASAMAAIGEGRTKPNVIDSIRVPDVCVALALLAVLHVWFDAYQGSSLTSLGPQFLTTLPFLMGAGFLVKYRAWLDACGSAGFYATAVAMLFVNAGGGWAGYLCVYCH